MDAHDENCVKKDDEAMEKVNEILILAEEGGVYREQLQRAVSAQEIKIGLLTFNCAANLLGSDATVDLLKSALTPTAAYVTSGTLAVLTGLSLSIPAVTSKIATEAGEEVANDIAKEFVKDLYAGATKEFVRKQATLAAQEAFQKTMKEMAEVAVKETLDDAAKLAVNKAANEAAKKAANETAKKAAHEAAKKASEFALKTAGQVTGCVTAGLGGLSIALDVYHYHKGKEKINSKSELGDSLRELADLLEKEFEKAVKAAT